MGLKLTRALWIAATLLAATVLSTAAEATTYDVSFSLSTFPGDAAFGSGTGTFENTVKHPDFFKSSDLSVSITETGTDDDTDTFNFKSAVATFSKAGNLTSLTGFDAITGDSVTLAFLGGLFIDSDYCTTDGNSCGRNKGPRDTAFQISSAIVTNPNLSSTPLPATWPMMAIGLFGLGLVAHRTAGKKSARYAIA